MKEAVSNFKQRQVVKLEKRGRDIVNITNFLKELKQNPGEKGVNMDVLIKYVDVNIIEQEIKKELNAERLDLETLLYFIDVNVFTKAIMNEKTIIEAIIESIIEFLPGRNKVADSIIYNNDAEYGGEDR